MRYLIFILTFLGFSHLTQAQLHGSDPSIEGKSVVTDKEMKSDSYLRQVQSPFVPKAVKDYQLMAVQYDVAQSDLFDGRDALFLVIFRTIKGSIEASYDWTGELVETVERFRNIALPRKIILSGMKNYSGWRVIGTNYYVYYVKERKKRILYTIQIADGKNRKKILLDEEGLIVN